MKLIQVLGPGCPRCEKLKKNAEDAVKQAGVEAIVEKVTDINVIMTPALVIDGEVKVVGKVATAEEIQKLL